MKHIPASGYYFANTFALTAIQALEEIVGKNGMDAILNLANLSHLIDNYPPDNLEQRFDFASFSAITSALEEIYGDRGGGGLTMLAGKATFNNALRDFGALACMANPAFRGLPQPIKLQIGLPVLARVINQYCDQHSTVYESMDEFVFSVQRCPLCWGRNGGDKPLCTMTTGLLQAGLKWISGGSEFSVQETSCIAMGDETCDFRIKKNPLQ